MRIAVVGGGPGGLYFAALIKRLDPRHRITVWERNPADSTFGFGVVFSEETRRGVEHADPGVHAEMAAAFARWDDIDVRYRGESLTCGGHGFAAISRKRLLAILRERCARLGVRMCFGAAAPDVDSLSAGYDLVVAADGVHSAVRSRFAETFRPSVTVGRCRYIWLGTDLVFESFLFDIRESPHGVVQLHGYPYSADRSTFIVEMHEDVWRAAGFDEHDERAAALPAGHSDQRSITALGALFADVLGGHRLYGDNSRWLSFRTVRTENWRHGNVVLLGDAAHTAHFSVGSGTKLAVEDALALAACLTEQGDLDQALAAYQAERQPVVQSTQRAAAASQEWFENLRYYTHQAPRQFAFNILTRSRRITYDNLALRDPEFITASNTWFQRDETASGTGTRPDTPPMFTPFRLGELLLPNRVVVSSMDIYSAVDGVPGDFHLVHLGGQALGGAGLVMTEMVCVSAAGRITPGCAGLYTDDQEAAWRRVVQFTHTHSSARIGLQLGHSGRKGSTKLMWEGMDEPLETGNWPVVGPSPIRYTPVSQTPRQLGPADLAEITAQFTGAARRAARAGFDVLELHCAHGYLLSSFLSPLTNHRTDGYGGSRANRLRYPLEVFDAVRSVWPAERPLTVRISATDWCPGGTTVDDAVVIAREFLRHGASAINVSTGQVVKAERPAFGRSYQTSFADRIRNAACREHGGAVIAVGAISSYDDVNSILLAGRADLCALGRPHLYDSQWTLHAAAEQDYSGPGAVWPVQFRAGSRKPRTGRADGPKPRLEILQGGPPATAHTRWRPLHTRR